MSLQSVQSEVFSVFTTIKEMFNKRRLLAHVIFLAVFSVYLRGGCTVEASSLNTPIFFKVSQLFSFVHLKPPGGQKFSPPALHWNAAYVSLNTHFQSTESGVNIQIFSLLNGPSSKNAESYNVYYTSQQRCESPHIHSSSRRTDTCVEKDLTDCLVR